MKLLRKIHYLIFFWLLFITFSHLEGQNNFSKDWHLGVAYYGNNAWNPGLQITAQKVIWDRTKEKVRNNGKVQIKHQQFLFDANIGYFYDNPSQHVAFNNFQSLYRRVREKGKYRSMGLGLGYMRTFLPETYTVDQGGNVSQVDNPGYWYFTPTFTLGVGRLWKRNVSLPWRIQVHTLFMTNYNVGINPLLNIEYGYLFGYRSKENIDDEF
jgi:hypothetical protein